jgi:hypothetical protein
MQLTTVSEILCFMFNHTLALPPNHQVPESVLDDLGGALFLVNLLISASQWASETKLKAANYR